MSIGATIILAALAIIVFAISWSFVRGLQKQRISAILTLLCAVVAVIATIALKNSVLSNASLNETLSEAAQSATASNETLGSVVDGLCDPESTLYQIFAGTAVSLVNPLVCLALFIVIRVVVGILSFIICLFFHGKFKEMNENASVKILRTIALAVLEAVIVLGVFMVPVSYYSGIASPALDAVKEEELISDTSALDTASAALDEVSASPLTKVFRALGGEKLTDKMTDISFAYNGEVINTSLDKELPAMTHLAGKIVKFKDFSFSNLSENDIQRLDDVIDAYSDSKMLSTTVCCFLKDATDEWKKEDGSYMGIKTPSFGNADMPQIDNMLDMLIETINEDAKTPDLVTEDLRTIADFLRVVVRRNVMSGFTGNDLSGLMDLLKSEETADGQQDGIAELTGTLRKNARLAKIADELDSIVETAKNKAFAEVLGISEEDAQKVNEKTDKICGEAAGTINDILNNNSLTKEEQRTNMESELSNIINLNAGEEGVTLSDTEVNELSAEITKEFMDNPGKYENVSDADVKNYLMNYAKDKAVGMTLD